MCWDRVGADHRCSLCQTVTACPARTIVFSRGGSA
ncbi:hypothetical protein GLR48_20055 [Loktanella sp. M215]|nr:hypothetical protein [Loktanella sp. M215]